MNQIVRITVIISFLSFYSYSQKKELDDIYINCAENDMFHGIKHVLGTENINIRFFDSISKFESFLIEEQLLLGGNKNHFKNLINKLEDNNYDSVF